jgi:nitrate reductase assembly molybdenum cofactor insertion protein NarJ
MADLDKKWNMQYEKLVEFKRKKGHCIVPYMYKEDKSLGQWVLTQRRAHTKSKLRPDRKELLDKIGFAWHAGNVNNIAIQDKKWHQ